MHLLSCRLQRVRQHLDLQLSFGRQLTLIGGVNESGKSTLVEALHKTLFLRSTATGRGVEELRSRTHGGLPEIELCFAAQGQRWTLRKRFAGAGGTCQLSNQQGQAHSGPAAEEELARLLGLEGPIEGRRIAQLPERWAHLWVRQGDSGFNPLEGKPESYDYERLLQQLQAKTNLGTMQSPLDRQVVEQLQQRLGQLFTATGRIKAGSPLAQVIQREEEGIEQCNAAQQQLLELEQAMERLGAIAERLNSIDQDLRPGLLRERELEQRQHLLQAELEPVLLQHQALERQHKQRQELERTQQEQQKEQRQLQQQLEQALTQQAQRSADQERQAQQSKAAEQHLQHLRAKQERVRQRLDLQQVRRERQQLEAHQQEMNRLQAEASRLKQTLADLPMITAEQVRSLRRAEQAIAQAEARLEAMATSIEVLQSDQAIQLGGALIQPGERRQLNSISDLQVGDGVRLRVSPGGGDALPQSQAQLERCHQDCGLLAKQLGVANSEAAEAIEQRRRSLEQELSTLRQAAKAIPWSGLSERLAALLPRQGELERAIAQASPEELPDAPTALEALDAELRESIQRQSSALEAQQQQQNQERQQEQVQARQLEQQRSRLEQLSGSLAMLNARLQEEAPAEASAERLKELEQELLQRRGTLGAIEAERQQLQRQRPGSLGAAQLLEQLNQEKELLLNERGQNEQRCASLGAQNPSAQLELAQARLENVQRERRQQEREAQALQLLQEHFHQAQAELANRYSEPLCAALNPYLDVLLNAGSERALLEFNPKYGFQQLQLLQDNQAYDFGRLSGGMREQLAGALRLAMAEVLMQAYDGALPLVFDDAFTNTDRQRLAQLQGMLQRGMEQGLQLILLSCHPEDYQHVLNWAQEKSPSDSIEGATGVEVKLSRSS
ncbi:AAA family ATPase [Synechococcus sp. LTW-R]|uniref:AAA family ATPase n=1 Tax=Synechococcus sp. LTW-R TaxID=2751170 RepID=UPI00162A9B82|nr:AAA family ATPase [Synechococcus sp. LTW-R]QNG29685.1 AAA family ATPase [Synechococcus sp. LTW-R]